MIKVFLDANIYFAAFVSASGASHLILEIGRREKIILYSSKLVLREAERNLRIKAAESNLKLFRRYLQTHKIHVIPSVEDKALEALEPLVHPKDLPVLAAALASGSDYLITLDRRHFFTPALQSFRKVKIMTPGDFIRFVYLKGKI